MSEELERSGRGEGGGKCVKINEIKFKVCEQGRSKGKMITFAGDCTIITKRQDRNGRHERSHYRRWGIRPGVQAHE